MKINSGTSLADTKHTSQVFANLVFANHNLVMKIQDVRRSQLKKWFSSHKIPEKEKSYISQLISGKSSFGEKAARRLEKDYKMPPKYLDSEDDDILGIDISSLSLDDIEYLKAALSVPKEKRGDAKKIINVFSESNGENGEEEKAK